MPESKVIKGRKSEPRRVECRAVGCSAEQLDESLKALNAEGWYVRQIFQEPPLSYRIFAERQIAIS
jgi:DNA-binding HxlR family transcriptional regulator